VSTCNDGRLFVSDCDLHCIHAFDCDGKFLFRWGREGGGLGQFRQPGGICVAEGRVYVCDEGNHRVQVFDENGSFQRVWGTRGSGDGQFDKPRGVAARGGLLFVSDFYNVRVQVFEASSGAFLYDWKHEAEDAALSGPVGSSAPHIQTCTHAFMQTDHTDKKNRALSTYLWLVKIELRLFL
jgi:tripartite motif-containing protein 71